MQTGYFPKTNFSSAATEGTTSLLAPSQRHYLLCALQIRLSGNRGPRAGPDICHRQGSAGLAGNPHVHGILSKPTALLEEVVGGSRGPLPGLPAVGANLELRDGLVGVHDLHGEPVGRGSLLVLEDEGRGNPAGDEGPGDGDDALGDVC